MDIALVISIVITFCIGLVGIYYNLTVIGVLRERYNEKWKEMGSFTFFINNSILNNYIFLKFLFKKQYMELDGDDFHKLCYRARISTLSFYVSFALFITLFAFALLNSIRQ